MSSSVIAIAVLDADGGKVHRKRFTISDDSVTIAAAIQNGLGRLQMTSLQCQFHMVGQERGSENTFSVLLDDMIELGHDYTFTDCNIRDSAAPAPSTSYASNSADPPSSTERGTPTTPPRATFARPPATPTTPTTSRPTFERYRETPTTLTSAPSTPTHASDGRTAVFIPVSFDSVSSPTALPMSANNTPTSSHLLPKYTTISKTKKMNNFYVDNMAEVEALFVSKKETCSKKFHDINVFDRFGLFQHWKAAFFILCQQKNPELYDAAIFVMTDVCFEILRSVWPKLNVIPAEKQMLAIIVSELTGYPALKNITLPNRSGSLDYKVKHFRRQNLDGSTDMPSPSAKRIKLSDRVDLVAEIDRLSIKLNPESDSRVLHQLYEKSAIQRYSWEKELHGDPSLKNGIITKLVSKFRHITSDISLIRYDFNILMATRRSPVKSLSETFRHLLPAIYQLALDLGIPGAQQSYDSPDVREYMAGPLLSAILKVKSPKSAVEYSRLVIDHSDSLNHKNAMEKRKAEGITAPTIIIIGSTPTVSFFIAADDMIFKVRGRFADALQSYMELIFVSNVKYDKKTTGISYFFEYLMNMKEHQNACRMAVAKELETTAAAMVQQSVVAETPPLQNDDFTVNRSPQNDGVNGSINGDQ